MELKTRSHVQLLFTVALIFLHASTTWIGPAHATANNNVAVQWNRLASFLVCAGTGFQVFGTGPLFPQLHLAQWHALLALKGTGSCTTEEAVVAFASQRVLAAYFPTWQDLAIDPLLDEQIRTLHLSDSQSKLAKRLGSAVADDLLHSRDLKRDFALKEIKDSLNARLHDQTPGLFSYHNATPAGIASAVFVSSLNTNPFVIPDPIAYIEEYLDDVKPPEVPSDAWDKEYEFLKDRGRVDWAGRTQEINFTAALYGCFVTGHCNLEVLSFRVAREVIPGSTPLARTVVLFAQMSVAIHDAGLVVGALQWGYSFWRPFLAFRRGDPRHAPLPTWTPFSDNPFHAEFPSGTAGIMGAGIGVLQEWFGEDVTVPFSLDRGVVRQEPCAVPVGTVIGRRRYASLGAIVEESKWGRVYAGGHWNISVVDGARVGGKVAKYVVRHWGAKTTPSGVLPNTVYLNVVAKQPKKAGQFSPLTVDF